MAPGFSTPPHGQAPRRRFRWLAHAMAAAWLSVGLAACSTLPAPRPEAQTTAIADFDRTPLASIVGQALPEDGRSGFLLQPYGPNAFATRLALTRLATRSLDVQYYLLQGDNTGRSLMRALRDAAARGVRVRVLIDDLYTAGEDELLLGLASYPNVEVRLFNPFPGGRQSDTTRFMSSALDFSRVNRRMHNKLFIADNAAAVVGGRNMADDYVQNADGRSFIDMDAFAAGPVVRQLSGEFDAYWNSEVVFPLHRIARSDSTAAQLQANFEKLTNAAHPPEVNELPADGRPQHPSPGDPEVVAPELIAMLNLPFQLERRQIGPLLRADAKVLFDAPTKIEGTAGPTSSIDGTVTEGVIDWFRTARRSIDMVSPYFVPSDSGVASLVGARQDGLQVRLVTNSLASTDEPWVYVGYSAHVRKLLEAGVVIEEISPSISVRRRKLGIFGRRTAALHMKCAIVDGRQVFLGSMNLDQRSARLNTELGVIIDSPMMAHQLQTMADNGSSYRLRLKGANGPVEWVEQDDTGKETAHDEPPETTAWQRFWLRVVGPFIPELEL